jgi:TPP-dependent pyruvate/acetoin dehydrogenase alpha subunit
VWDEVKVELDAAIEFAKNSPFPKPEEALQDLFVNA